MPEEQFEVIDKEGKVIGLKPRSEVHAKGLRHKGIYLMVFDEKDKVFVQQRAANKDIEPLKWDFSMAGHLSPGEDFEKACLREAREELGIKVRNPKLVDEINWKYEYSNGLKDNELNHFFSAKFEGEIKFQDGEVKQGKWLSLRELLQEMKEKPEKFTPWFLNCGKQLEEMASQ